MEKEIEILLVEDNSSDAEMTIRALNKNNLSNRLLWVKDGSEALDFLYSEGPYAGKQTIHSLKVILLDLKMSKINGVEVLKRIKSNEATKKIPVVMLTSSQEDMDIKECYELGANGYVVKPLEFDDFHQAISNLGVYWLVFNEPAS